MSEDLRPEELWQSLSQSSRDAFSEDRIVDFLEEWSDSEAFVEDLEYVVTNDRDSVRPEEVFEHLAESSNYYTVDEMLEMAEEVSNRDWERGPEFSSTGGPVRPDLGDKVVVPGEREFQCLSESFFGRTELEDNGKDIWFTQHEDYFQFGISPISMEKLDEVFTGFEAQAPSRCFHEVEYGEEVYNLNSEDLSYFFEFRDDLNDFDGRLYRIESTYSDFVVEASKIPNEDLYEVSAFTWRRTDDPLEAVESVLRPEVIQGLRTKLMLQYIED